MTSSDRLRELLVLTRQKIVDHGWKQYKMGDDAMGYCLTGAFSVVKRECIPEEAGCPGCVDARLFYKAMGEAVGHEKWVTSWNDSDGRTKEEVIDLLDRMIEVAT